MGDRGADQAGLLAAAARALWTLHRHMRLRRTGAHADAGELGQALAHQIAEGAIGDLREQGFAAFGQAGLAVEAGEVHVAGQLRVEEFGQRGGDLQARIEAGHALLAHQRIGVFAVRQEQEQRLTAILHARQH